MKQFIITSILLLSFSVSINAQSFDLELEKMSATLSKRLNRSSELNIAVYPFYDENKQKSRAGYTISQDLWTYLVNDASENNVMSRDYMKTYDEEFEFEKEGYFDPATAKQYSMLIAADTYVTGTVRIFPTYLKINVVAIDVQTGRTLAAAIGRLPLDFETATYLGIENWRETKTKVEQNRSMNPKCEEYRVGDYCIENKTSNLYEVTAFKTGENYYSTRKYRMTLQPGETNCLRDLPEGAFKVRMTKRPSYADTTNPETTAYIEVCGAGRYTLR